MRIILLGKCKAGLDCNYRTYSQGGLAPTITTCCGGGHTPLIMENEIEIKCLNPKVGGGGATLLHGQGLLKRGDILRGDDRHVLPRERDGERE